MTDQPDNASQASTVSEIVKDLDHLAQEFDPEALNAAVDLTQNVFTYADLNAPIMARLFSMGVESRLGQLARGGKTVAMEEHFFASLGPRKEADHVEYRVVDPDDILMPDMKLPSLPWEYAALQRLIDDESSSASDLARVVEKSPSLTTILLKLVNSPFYGLRARVETITRAVAVVGTRQLSMLALGASVMSSFRDVPFTLVDVGSFWLHCLGAGLAARALAERAGFEDGERFFVAGLLHDIGRVVLFQAKPELMAEAFELSKQAHLPLHYAELDVVNYDHSAMGFVALNRWNLPEFLAESALFHHSPDIKDDPREMTIVHLSDLISRALGIGCSGQYFMAPLKEEAWQTLNMSVEDLEHAAKATLEQIDPLREAFALR